MKNNQPTHTIFQVIEREKDIRLWSKIGTAWMHQDGEGFNLAFDAFPLTGNVVVRKKPSDWVLGMLAAGPVEDLLQQSGSQFIERIETEARRDPTFRSMLNGVWKSGSPEVWTRLEAARGDAGHAA